jgi:citrate lyase subunit gamma (acyl carrier protein)
MKIIKPVLAGSLESNDVLITLRPSPRDVLELEIESIVSEQYSDRIREVVEEVLGTYGVESGLVIVQDRGALDFTLRARMKTAVLRAKGEEEQ